jgi:hypothetical protein
MHLKSWLVEHCFGVYDFLKILKFVIIHWANQKQSELYKNPDVLAYIKKRKLEWLGYVIKMNRKRKVKKNFENIGRK